MGRRVMNVPRWLMEWTMWYVKLINTGANIDVLLRLWDEGFALFGTPAYEFSVKVIRSQWPK